MLVDCGFVRGVIVLAYDVFGLVAMGIERCFLNLTNVIVFFDWPDVNLLMDGFYFVINFFREDGSSEVQLGNTHVMAFVTSQLVQPYRDRPNEGTLSFYTEFSPMADPSFEAGRPGEFAVELGRIIDRGLRYHVILASLCSGIE